MGQGWPVTACPRSGTGTREPERSEGRTPGQGLFGSFCGCLTKGTRRKGETIISVNRKCRICTPCARCFAKRPHLCRVHIHSMCHGSLRVPPLRRVTFSRRRKSNQKGLPYHTAASPRLGGALTPALSWGHAAEERSEAAIDRKAVAEPEHAVCLKNREADFTTAASQWRTKPDAPSHGSSATTDRRFTTA